MCVWTDKAPPVAVAAPTTSVACQWSRLGQTYKSKELPKQSHGRGRGRSKHYIETKAKAQFRMPVDLFWCVFTRRALVSLGAAAVKQVVIIIAGWNDTYRLVIRPT
jgi:hypothetical protein